MDLTQQKLTKTEWENIEIPVSPQEHSILRLIQKGFHDPKLRTNDNTSLFSFVKISKTPGNELHLYNSYFKDNIQALLRDHPALHVRPPAAVAAKTRKIDILRLDHLKADIENNKHNIVEFFLFDFAREMLTAYKTQKSHHFYLYTLLQFRQTAIAYLNSHVMDFIHTATEWVAAATPIEEIVYRCDTCIEQNPHLLKYEDRTLFSHQSQLFDYFRREENASVPTLVLYTAPTGTGKTLSPLGLAEKYRILFVCVARHIGLSLAKSAVSIGKRVAFAFGCETASDIRLHNLAASAYTLDYKTGGIFRVDNSVGDKVEIMICDVKSYLVAMRYMLAFHSVDDMITYWDEPTITMDYETHELHEAIHANWVENKIPKIILSCATLPQQLEIMPTLVDFRARYEGAHVLAIDSYDCKKSVSLVDLQGRCALPHLLFARYADALRSAEYCMQQKTLLRYMDVYEIIRFIKYVEPLVEDDRYKIRAYFGTDLAAVSLISLKMYYLVLICNVDCDLWTQIHQELKMTQRPKFAAAAAAAGEPLRKIHSVSAPAARPGPGQPLTKHLSLAGAPAPGAGVLLTTQDAHTLTDGPTIFIVEDVMKIGTFYIQQSKIPEALFHALLDKIHNNNNIQVKATALEKTIEDELGKETEKEKKMEREHFSANVRRLKDELTKLQSKIQAVYLNHVYVPNTREHQEKWVGEGRLVPHAFVPQIDEEYIKRIMLLEVETQMKILLLLGIGVFVKHTSVAYMEIMKALAYQQKLFLIIASSDFIYGTNYQFCHGFLGKDLNNMTQQKTIQAMGRVGRNNIQQEYTVRFRDDTLLTKLFLPAERNLEAVVMSALFNS
jgi:hypothetical protein